MYVIFIFFVGSVLTEIANVKLSLTSKAIYSVQAGMASLYATDSGI
jgi:hypothetical protein